MEGARGISDWDLILAKDYCESVRDGTHDTPKPVEQGGKPLVTSRHIKNGRVDLECAYHISLEDFDKINERSRVDRWDVLMSMIGTVGECAMVKDTVDFAIKNLALFKMGGDETRAKWLYYYLKSPLGQGQLRANHKGASQQFISLAQLRNLEIPLPPLPVQRRIADILSAYDDLIENNRRRIAILEETARLAYRKWFGGGEGRELPLAEVADVLYGKDHKKIPDGDIPIFGSGGIMRYGAKAIYEQPSVLIPRKGTISNVMYVEEPFWTVDTMFYTRVKIPNMERILYYQLCDYNIASMSTGAAVPSMTTAILNALQIVVPPSELRQRFDKAVSPMFEQCRILKKQSAALAAARDMLLPRLMKGEVA